MLKAAGVAEFAHNTPGLIPRHWRRRAALARALALRPEILILENPLRGLDSRQAIWWTSFVKRLWRGHDLMSGRPSGDESRKVIIDLKTGRPNARHRQDLGFYALIETLARDVPPRKLATFYLDASEAQSEDVSERLLRSAIRRTLDGINAIIELEYEGRAPIRRPGSSCRWCPLADTCPDGRQYLDGASDDA